MESTKLIKNKVYNFYLSYKNILLMPSYFIQSIPLTCENVRELIFSSNWSTEEGRKSTKVEKNLLRALLLYSVRVTLQPRDTDVSFILDRF